MNEPRYLIDSYLDFIGGEGIPIAEGFGLDLLALDTRPWPRMGPVNGSYALTSGRGDFIDMYVLDVPPARVASAPKDRADHPRGDGRDRLSGDADAGADPARAVAAERP